MTRNPYNGWTNYETWNIKLWIDNEQAWQEQALEIARHADEDISDCARALEQWALDPETGMFPDTLPTCGPVADALTVYRSEIDWYSIAESYLEDAKEIPAE